MTASGLTDAEVAQRVAQGNGNDIPERARGGVVDIIRANVFTRINAILGVLLIIVLATGSVINGMFGLLMPRAWHMWSSSAFRLAREKFFLDTSNLAVTSVAL